MKLQLPHGDAPTPPRARLTAARGRRTARPMDRCTCFSL